LAIRSVATRSETIRPAPAVWKEKPMTIHYRDHLIETAIYEPRDGKTYVPRATLCRYVGPKAKVKDLSWPNRVCRTWIDAATLAISLAKAAIDRGEGVEDTPTRHKSPRGREGLARPGSIGCGIPLRAPRCPHTSQPPLPRRAGTARSGRGPGK
jgi:hypothetical protein